jgi:hypothetical protein
MVDEPVELVSKFFDGEALKPRQNSHAPVRFQLG